MSIFWLRVAAGLYSVGLLHAILSILKGKVQVFGPATAAFCIGVTLHFVSIVELSIYFGRIPLDNFHESLSVCAFLVAAAFLFVYWRYQFATISIFLFPLVFFMTLVASTELPVGYWSDTRVRDAWLLIHVLLILLGYAALLLTAVASLFYLMRERQLKSKKPGAFSERLPPLGTLDNLITSSMNLGFVFITLGMIAAITWAFVESGTRWMMEPQIGIAFVTWLFFLVMVFLRSAAGWRGRKAAIMALTVLCCSALTWATHVGLRSLLIQ